MSVRCENENENEWSCGGVGWRKCQMGLNENLKLKLKVNVMEWRTMDRQMLRSEACT